MRERSEQLALSALTGLVALGLLLASQGVAGNPVPRVEVHPSGSPIVISSLSPLPGSTIYTETPNISATYSDSAGSIPTDDVFIVVDLINVTGLDEVTITPTKINYAVPPVLELKPGNHTVSVIITVPDLSPVIATWGFNVSSGGPPAPPAIAINGQAVLVFIAVGVVIVAVASGATYAYLRKKKKFTFEKYFATHPIQREYLTLYIPCIAAFFVVMGGLTFVFASPWLPWFSFDTVLLAGFLVAVSTYGIDARREKARIRAFEAAFAEFLFELADALRGGIDPAKAIIEMSQTETDIMAKPLRIAADGLKIGKAFDQVLRDMVATMKSPLVARYAALIADGASVGGEASAVVYRAARDMDDFIKIERERSQQLTLPVGVVYISYGVLIAVLFALLYLAPSLGSLNLSVINSSGFGSSGGGASFANSAPSISFGTMRERFLELSIMIAIGNGALIGAFTDGKPKYGIPHSIGMAIGVLAVFIIFYP